MEFNPVDIVLRAKFIASLAIRMRERERHTRLCAKSRYIIIFILELFYNKTVNLFNPVEVERVCVSLCSP